MSKFDWSAIIRDDVIKAIDNFYRYEVDCPKARSTFLIYNDKQLPAKHIRGMAYKVHFGKEISKQDYSGGIETKLFFERLGFEVRYTGNTKQHSKETTTEIQNYKSETKNDKDLKLFISQENTSKSEKGIKIGLYLQTYNLHRQPSLFNKTMDKIRNSDIDILVFPEFSYVPFANEFIGSDWADIDDADFLCKKAIELSQNIECAVIVCNQDSFGTIISIYANAFASEEETKTKYYIKHTQTDYSAFDFKDYKELSKELFEPIIYKGKRIGTTICYDCNHALFSRMYGINGVDIIINSTGGNVVYDKWYKYNKARAIENNCFTFVTMGGDDLEEKSNSFVYGFAPSGKELIPTLLNGQKAEKLNIPGTIYIYDTSSYDGTSEEDRSINQAESINKNIDILISENDIDGFIKSGYAISDNIRIVKNKGNTIVLCLINEDEIMKPEKVLKLLYSEKLKEIENKRYIIINHWDKLDSEFYKTKLSVVLKVRAMENYCTVILDSDKCTKCFQCGQNRTAQVIQPEKGKFGIDLKRTGGPETIWRNKQGMRKEWRTNFEWLIDSI